jgi:hypothetical protein
MVGFDEQPILPPRDSNTVEYPLKQGPGQEQDLYDQVTAYCQTHYDRAKLRNRSAAGPALPPDEAEARRDAHAEAMAR